MNHYLNLKGIIFSNLFFVISIGVFLLLYTLNAPFLKNQKTETSKELELTVEVISYPKVFEKYKEYKVKFSENNLTLIILLRAGLNFNFQIGDSINLKGRIACSSNVYLHSQGVQGIVISPKIIRIVGSNHPDRYLSFFRNSIIDRVNSLWHGNVSNLILGLLIGADSSFSDEMRGKFLDSGTLHIIAVSGFNINIIGSILMIITPHIGRKKTVIISILLLYYYYLLVGWDNIPCLRAFLMFGTDEIFKSIGVRPGKLQVFGLALLVIMLMWPYSVNSISLQLSFLSSFSLILLRLVINYLNYSNIPIWVESVLTNISCSLGSFPILIKIGNPPTIKNVIGNVLVSPIILSLMLLSFIAIIFSNVNLEIARLIAVVVDIAANMVLFGIVFSASLDS